MKNTGYTLMELMIVLVLTGLALAIATPPMADAVRRTQTQVAGDEFLTRHGLARSVAIRFGRLTEVHIDATNGRFWVEVDTSQAGGMKDTIGVVKHLENMSLTSDRSLLCFDSRGLPTTRGSCESADATLVFTAENVVDTLKITALGKVLR